MSVRYKDYYKVLGVGRDATKDEIRKAYRKLARQWHPDHNKDPDASKKFQEINEAHQVLSDEEKRARFDQLGQAYADGQDFRPPPGFEGFSGGPGGFEYTFQGGGPHGGAGGFSDFFSMLFGEDGPFAGRGGGGGFEQAFGGGQGFGGRTAGRRGEDLEANLELSLEQALAGGKHSFALETVVSRPDGTVGNETRRFELKIPHGVKEGTRVRLKGQGGPGRGGGPAGDLLLRIHFEKHPRFEVDGHDLRGPVYVPAWKAVLGGTAKLTMLDGKVATLKIAAGTKDGSTLRLRGQGLPRGDGDARGDLLMQVRIDIPTELDDERRAAWERLRDLDAGNASDDDAAKA